MRLLQNLEHGLLIVAKFKFLHDSGFSRAAALLCLALLFAGCLQGARVVGNVSNSPTGKYSCYVFQTGLSPVFEIRVIDRASGEILKREYAEVRMDEAEELRQLIGRNGIQFKWSSDEKKVIVSGGVIPVCQIAID